jgi:putative FmdB family regulatory protein
MYEYFCDHCEHVFTELRPMAEHRAPRPCQLCASEARRIVGTAPRLNDMPQTRRQAHETNERSAHEPRVRQHHQCGAGCSHHGGSAAAKRLQQPARRGARPWMLGH